MTYIRSRNQSYSKSSIVYILLLLFVIISVVILRIFYPQVIVGFFTAIGRPFWRTEFSISSGQLQSLESILKDKEELSRKLDLANASLGSLSVISLENEQLKSMMGRTAITSNSRHLLAAVLERPPFAMYDELILDVGTDLGVKVGDTVYAAGRVPIGKVAEVLTHSAKVLMFSSPGQRTEILVGNSNVAATAVGRGGGQYYAELPRDTEIHIGDSVSIPSIDSNLYGVVDDITSDPSQAFERVLFKAPVNIYQLRWVEVDIGID